MIFDNTYRHSTGYYLQIHHNLMYLLAEVNDLDDASLLGGGWDDSKRAGNNYHLEKRDDRVCFR